MCAKEKLEDGGEAGWGPCALFSPDSVLPDWAVLNVILKCMFVRKRY